MKIKAWTIIDSEDKPAIVEDFELKFSFYMIFKTEVGAWAYKKIHHIKGKVDRVEITINEKNNR